MVTVGNEGALGNYIVYLVIREVDRVLLLFTSPDVHLVASLRWHIICPIIGM